jgi:KRAB domain-containing zinc finger protein
LASALDAYMRGHAAIEAGSLPYKCRVCSSAFSTRSLLRAHAREHADERSHARCERVKPAVNPRVHNGQLPFKCDHCHAAFARPSDLSRHARKHGPEQV